MRNKILNFYNGKVIWKLEGKLIKCEIVWNWNSKKSWKIVIAIECFRKKKINEKRNVDINRNKIGWCLKEYREKEYSEIQW